MRMHDFLMSKWAYLILMFIGGFVIVYNDRLAFDFSDILGGIFYLIALVVIIWQGWTAKKSSKK
ncbi:hypothetical protein ACTVHC_13880 [Lentilactobacillus hilgardii]|nr:hypothetical protein [Lentilactobacillus buchneri]